MPAFEIRAPLGCASEMHACWLRAADTHCAFCLLMSERASWIRFLSSASRRAKVTEVLSSWEPEAWLESSPLRSRATAIVAGAGGRR